MLNQISINVSLVEALEKMPGYVKFRKDLVTKKRSVTFEDEDRLQHCSVIATRSLVQKKDNPDAFTILCTVGSLHFSKALCDLGASINLMPLSIYKKLGLGDPKPIMMRLVMADRTVKRPIGILHNVLVKVESFIFPANFVILDCRALVYIEKGQMTFRLNNEEATFNNCRTIRQSGELQSVFAISHKEKMKKENEQKIAKQELMVGDLVLLVISGVLCLPGISSPNRVALT
ncbi:uncharacterized protein [Solanum lycopersicum]|uniref:uncharacterized protein n=1 Tax=Solanum lycopersicum TaxID=4081 RepID=UPI003748E4BA